MEKFRKFRNDKKVLNPISIEKFDDFSKAWILNDSVYYLGSFVYDINDELQGIVEHWAGDINSADEDDKDKAKEIAQKEDYQRIYEVFHRRPNDDEAQITITECIQKNYLIIIKDQVLHLFRESNKNCHEILTRDGEIYASNRKPKCSYLHEPYDDTQSLLTSLVGDKSNIIKSTFDFHFNLIKDTNNSHVYFFPSVLGHKIINVSVVVSPSELDDSDVSSIQLGLEISTSRIMSDTALYLNNLAQCEAIKSAKAAIMSRNMSHNIGSHVLSYLKQKLGNITSILSNENKVLYNLTDDKYLLELLKQKELDENASLQELLIKNLQELLKKSETSSNEVLKDLIKKNLVELLKKDNFEADTDNGLQGQSLVPIKTSENDNSVENKKTKKPIQFPFLVGTGRFIGYIQERQDYIATIATDYIPYGAPVNMKDAIYDELNPDLRHMRHNDNDGNRPMNVLLNYIAKSEGLSRENMKKDNSEARFDTQNDILFGFPKYEEEGANPHVFGLLPTHCESDDPALTEMRKINFSLPGGLVGRQAIFSIVENLIRNAAKHGDPRSTKPNNKGNLELTFDVIDLANLANCKCLYNRICDPVWRTLYNSASDRELLYLFTITDNLIYKVDSENKTLAEKLRSALVEDYLDERGNMRPTNKGIKEIRISAAWMRNEIDEECYLKYEDYQGEEHVLPNKKAPLVGLEITNEGHLRYMICVPQDRLGAVITEGMSDDDLNIFKELHGYSEKDWKLYSTIDEARKDSKISFHYMFVSNDNIYKELRPYTSNRLFVWKPNNDERNEIEAARHKKNDTETKYNFIKNAIVRSLYHVNDNSDPIYIWDEKTLNNIDKNRDDSITGRVLVSSNDVDTGKAKYVYRTHHSTDTQFEAYWMKKSKTEGEYKETYNNILCIDSITGDNSSDRIVRREPLNEEWYCSHLCALKKRIAIIDERLFKIVHNVEESKFVVKNQTGDESVVESLIKRLRNGEDLQKIKDDIVKQKMLGDESDCERMVRLSQTAEILIKNLEKRVTFFQPYNGNKNNYKSIVYKEKGVDVFTIIREKENTFAIVGYVSNETDSAGGLKKVLYDKIATITYTPTPFNVKFDFLKTEFAKQYDYISIHQGILDKIYEGFGIKEHGEENDPKKCIVTRRMHEEFMKAKEYEPIAVIDENGNHKEDFLPCFIIHSGRAKPTKNDMPQEQPFVQYAAIEHGVLDCKYALVELLDYARYEM